MTERSRIEAEFTELLAGLALMHQPMSRQQFVHQLRRRLDNRVAIRNVEEPRLQSTEIVTACAPVPVGLREVVEVIVLFSPAAVQLSGFRRLLHEREVADVLLDSDWSALRGPLGAVWPPNPGRIYQRATDHQLSSPPEWCESAWDMFVDLSGQNAPRSGLPPGMVFLLLLEQVVDSATAAAIRRRNQRQATELGLTELLDKRRAVMNTGADRPLEPSVYLVIQVEAGRDQAHGDGHGALPGRRRRRPGSARRVPRPARPGRRARAGPASRRGTPAGVGSLLGLRPGRLGPAGRGDLATGPAGVPVDGRRPLRPAARRWRPVPGAAATGAAGPVAARHRAGRGGDRDAGGRQWSVATGARVGVGTEVLLARTLADGALHELSRIRLAVLFACPNAGSGLGLPLRRRAWFWRHPQEKELRPLNELVVETQRTVLNRLVHADPPAVRLVVYAGDRDAVVTPASARSVFPDAGVLPGDHFSIVQPDSPAHRSYAALKHDLLTHVLAPSEPANAPGTAAPSTVAGPSRSGPVSTPATDDGLLVDRLLAVPGMTDRSFRQRVYGHLPMRVREQLPDHERARVELIGVVAVLREFRHLAAGEALLAGIRSAVPDHPSIADLAATMKEFDLAATPPTSRTREG